MKTAIAQRGGEAWDERWMEGADSPKPTERFFFDFLMCLDTLEIKRVTSESCDFIKRLDYSVFLVLCLWLTVFV